MSAEQKHETTIHYGDWHRFAVCRTCFWEGTRSGVGGHGRGQSAEGRGHAREMHRRYLRARLVALFTRRKAVTHKVAPRSGEPLRCCDREPWTVSGLDRFTFDADEATCEDDS